MKKITIKKQPPVKNTDEEMLSNGIVSFQIVEFYIDFFGNTVETSHDTRIMKDGRQFVIGGCGFIPHDFEVTSLA